jgi:type IVB pilus formation R64 PilN family outer membrane protein
MFKAIKTALLLASVVFATGCTVINKVSEENRESIQNSASKDIKEAYKFLPKENELTNIIFDESFYIPIVEDSDRDMPKWFFKEENYQLNKYSLASFMSDLQKEHGINTSYKNGFDPSKVDFALRHKGTVGEALKKIALGTGLDFQVKDDLISWSRFQVKEFDVSFVPGFSSFMIGEKENNSQTTGQQNSAMQTVRSESVTGQSSEYANFEATDIGPWEDRKMSIELLKSDLGVFTVNQSLSTITVKDFPENITMIDELIQRANLKLSTNIAIEVKIIEYQNTDGADATINWQAIRQEMSGTSLVEASTNFASSLLSGSSPLLLGYEKTAGSMAGSQVLIEALEKQGTVRTVMEPRAIGLNNQISKIDVGGEEGYLASSGSTLTSNVGSSSVLIPGVVETGMKLYALPSANLDNDSVVVRMSTKFSSLDQLNTVKSGDALIQTPSRSKRDFFLTFAAKSGQTLLVTGLKNQRNEYQSSTPGSIALGGSKSGVDAYTETIMLITPRIMRGIK